MQQEERLEVDYKHKSLQIGLPIETSLQENRIGLAPDSVRVLVNNGHNVIIESTAGDGASFPDAYYSDAGAKIVYSQEEVFQADIILKVEPPTLKELDLFKPGQTLISALQLKIHNREYFTKLLSKKISAIAYDYIQDQEGMFPVIRSMSEIAGNTSILIAAECLSNVNSGKGVMLGGISGVKPADIVIVGAGTVAEFAARSAMGLGASVKIFDNSLFRLRRLQNDLHERIYTSTLQPKLLNDAISKCDVLIGAIRNFGVITSCVVTEEMVLSMSKGSVVIDVSIDQGGCVETSELTSHEDPIMLKHGILHYGVPNIPSRVARTASISLSNIFAPIFVALGEVGGIENNLRCDLGFRNGLYVYNGILINKWIGERFSIPFKDIDLLLATY